jgi:O-antigen/teichoic acid export membrane protein
MIRLIFLTLFTSGVFFAFNIMLAKILGAEAYGQIQYFTAYIQLVFLFVSINYASLYMGSKIIEGNNNTLGLFVSLQSSIFLLVILPAYFFLSSVIEERVMILLVLFIAYFLVLLASISLEYNSRGDVKNSIWIGSTLSRVIHIVIFSSCVFLGYTTSKLYFIIYLISIVFIVLYQLYRLRPKFYLEIKILHRVWKFYLLGLIGGSFIYIAQIFQKELHGYSHLASLALVLLIMNGIGMWGSLLIKITLPAIHKHWKSNDLNSISKIYKNNTYLELIVVLPIFILLIFNIEKLSSSLGTNYKQLPLIFYILFSSYMIEHITGITGTLLRVTGYENYELFNEIVRLMVGLLSIYLFRNYEYGIVIAIAISTAIYSILKFSELYYLFRVWPLSKRSSLQLVSILTIVCFCFYSLMTIKNSYTMLATILIFLIFLYYMIFVFIIKKNKIIMSMTLKSQTA